MGRHWARQELDYRIMNYIDQHRALRGRTIAQLVSEGRIQKGYDRLKALRTLGLVAGIRFTETMKINSKKQMNRKRGTLFYLTTNGVAELKKLRGLEPDGSERNQRPDEEQVKSLFLASMVIENVALQFGNSRQYKLRKGFPNFYILDLLYGDWQIIIQRNNSAGYKKRLLDQSIQSLSKNLNKKIILSGSHAKINSLLRMWTEQRGPNTRFLLQDDYDGIELVLQEKVIDEAEETLSGSGYRLFKYPNAQDGFEYRINDASTNIIDLVGFPARVFRQLKNAPPGMYVALREGELSFLKKYHPDLINNHYPVLLKRGQVSEELMFDNDDPWRELACENQFED